MKIAEKFNDTYNEYGVRRIYSYYGHGLNIFRGLYIYHVNRSNYNRYCTLFLIVPFSLIYHHSGFELFLVETKSMLDFQPNLMQRLNLIDFDLIYTQWLHPKRYNR